MSEAITAFITWTTYGTWLPGDGRGWRKTGAGSQQPRPNLERWCREKMSAAAVLLSPHHREAVESACRDHSNFRGWELHAVNARTNHVHVIVEGAEAPQRMRDQLKANSTRWLRQVEPPLVADRTWTRGGDCQILDKEEDIEAAAAYVMEAQDRMGRESCVSNYRRENRNENNNQ